MTRTARVASIVVLLLALAAIVGPRIFSSSPRASRAAAEPAASTEPQRTAVTVHTVRPQVLTEELSTTGTLRANEQVELTTEIAGKVASIHFREGSRVAAGDILMELDSSELTAQHERAAHRVDLARRREERQRQLLDDGLLSAQEYDFVRTELDVLRAELTLVEAQLSKTTMRAPFGGVIGLRFVSPGAYITPQTSVASLQDLDPIKVDFTVPERHASRIRLGDIVEIAVAGVEGRFPAEVFAIEPAVDPATRSLVVRARRANPDRKLLPGAFADVQVVVNEVPEALAVPSVAVVPELGGKKVFVVEQGHAQSRAVETGIRTDTMVEVTAGLEDGDQVIVGGVERVRTGDAVDIRSAD
jgi:membrane fusion protein (multidrug efflux system)